VSDLKRLQKAWYAAGERYFAAFRKAYPIGADIRWDMRGHLQYGEVRDHGYQDSLRVRNDTTGKEYMIHSYFVRPR
jgi:hypothetical protein